MSEPVRWGILSTSGIAMKRVIPAMRQAADCEIIAIASRDPDKARAAARDAGIPRAYGSYEELLADADIEAVYIPLPNTLHVPWSLKALAAGKHVLCEKPIAMNAAEARQLIGARERSGHLVEEGFPFVNHPQWDFMQARIAAGAIGEVRAVSAVIAYNNRDAGDLRNNPAEGGGGLYDIGCYLIQGCRIIFGDEPLRVIGRFEMDPAFGVDRLASAILEFPKGQATLITATQAGPTTGGSHQHLGILGSRGWMRADFPFSHSTPSPCRIYLGDASALGGLPTSEQVFPAVNQYQLQAERFSRLVRGLPARAWPIENGVANLRVIDALFRSRDSGTWEAV